MRTIRTTLLLLCLVGTASAVCGDGIRQQDEGCDGNDYAAHNCTEGILYCAPNCTVFCQPLTSITLTTEAPTTTTTTSTTLP
jgi:hypothetical protein